MGVQRIFTCINLEMIVVEKFTHVTPLVVLVAFMALWNMFHLFFLYKRSFYFMKKLMCARMVFLSPEDGDEQSQSTRRFCQWKITHEYFELLSDVIILTNARLPITNRINTCSIDILFIHHVVNLSGSCLKMYAKSEMSITNRIWWSFIYNLIKKPRHFFWL